MEALIALLFSDPLRGLLGILLLIVSWFIVRDHKRREAQFEGFESKMQVWESSLKNHMGSTCKALLRHSEDLGKATKAVNGDMLAIRENVFSLKEQLNAQLEILKNEAAKLERDFLAMAQRIELAAEKFEEKFGAIKNIQTEIEDLRGRIIHIYEDGNAVRVEVTKHADRFAKIAKALQLQKTAIDAMEKAGSKDEI